MLTSPFRYCNRFRCLNGGVATKSNFGHIISGIGHTRSYAKDKSCCPDKPQAEGKKIEPWPKADAPPPAWRCECPKEPQPSNYDPYRIKVPDVVVPPISTSNAKWTGVVFTVDREDKEASPAAARQPAAEQSDADPAAANLEDEAEEEEEEVQPKSEGFFAGLKSYFGFGKSKKGGADEVPSEDGREPFKSPEINLAMNANLQDLFYDSPIVHPDYWKDKTRKPLPVAADAASVPRLGYHGRSKYKFAFHEPWKPLDRLSLIAQAEKDEVEVGGVAETPENTDKQVT